MLAMPPKLRAHNTVFSNCVTQDAACAALVHAAGVTLDNKNKAGLMVSVGLGAGCRNNL